MTSLITSQSPSDGERGELGKKLVKSQVSGCERCDEGDGAGQ
jgi:hypothetical protein